MNGHGLSKMYTNTANSFSHCRCQHLFFFLTGLCDYITWNREVLTLNNILNIANSQNVVTPRNPHGIREITGNDASVSVYSMTYNMCTYSRNRTNNPSLI